MFAILWYYNMMINKFWAKMKMVFVGIGLMSMISFIIFIIHTVLFRIPSIIFIIISIISLIIAYYSNYRRKLELQQENVK
jgi:uncharacterized membrane protein YqjE